MLCEVKTIDSGGYMHDKGVHVSTRDQTLGKFECPVRLKTIWIVDAHRHNGKRFVVRADEKLTAFLELERITRESLRFSNAKRFGKMLATQGDKDEKL
jgi:hypothetical protein